MRFVAIAIGSVLLTAAGLFGFLGSPSVHDAPGDPSATPDRQTEEQIAQTYRPQEDTEAKLAAAAAALRAAARSRVEVDQAASPQTIPVPSEPSRLQELALDPSAGLARAEARKIRAWIKIEIEEALRDCLTVRKREPAWIHFTGRLEAVAASIEVKDLRLTLVSDSASIEPGERSCLDTRLTHITHVPDSTAAAEALGRLLPSYEPFQVEWPCGTCG